MFARSVLKILKCGQNTRLQTALPPLFAFGGNSGRRYLLMACVLRRPSPPLNQPYTVLRRQAFWRNIHHQKRSAATADFSALRTLWNKLFGKYLLATNVISSGILMVIGDILAQEIDYRRGAKHASQHYDLERMGRMFVVGALQGPLHHYVYNWMDRIMPVQNLRNTLWKILLDQIFMSPACIFIFFYSACYLERKSLTETNCELKEKFPIIYLMDWLMWPAVQFVNFRYLETKYRVMFVNVCTALYNIFMSYMKHDFNIVF